MPAEPKFGQLVPDDVAGRDAIHVAAIPMRAESQLDPGDHVGPVGDGDTAARHGATHVGIVDPFLKQSVLAGQRFWLFLYPGSVVGLRHAWSHPAFPDEPVAADAPTGPVASREAALAWFDTFILDHGLREDDYENPITRDRLIQIGHDAVNRTPRGDDAWFHVSCGASVELASMLGGHAAEFWRNWSAATGVKVPDDIADRSRFSCAC